MLRSEPLAVQQVAVTGSHSGLQFITDFPIHATLISTTRIPWIAPPEKWRLHTLGMCY